MADRQILAPGVSAAPLVYTIPGSSEIVLKSLFASFDGSAAAAAFYPCVRIIAPGGQVVGEYITDASVAAGSSAEVSFAPFLRGAASSAATATTPAWAVFTKETNMVIPTVTLTTLTSTSFATSDPTVFSSTPGGVAGDTTVALSGRGLYLAVGQVQWQTLGTYEHEAYVDVSPVLDNVPTWAAAWAGMLRWAYTLAGSSVGAVGFPNAGSISAVDVRPIIISSTFTPPVNVQLRAQQWSGADKNARGRLAVLYWPGTLTQTVVY